MPDVTKVTHVTDGSTLSRRNVLLGLMGTVGRRGDRGLRHRGLQPGRAGRRSAAPRPGVAAAACPATARRAGAAAGRRRVEHVAGPGDLLALTLDDGVDTDVVRAYAQLAKDTGIRLTMFVTGVFSSWTDNRDLLRPLVESGQIQLGNHTWLHHDLTKMTPPEVADELRHTDQFLRDTFGVDAAPYFRPPYGAYNDMVT